MTRDWFTRRDGSAISPEEVIKRLRRNMIIHSTLYYYYDDPVISDDMWQSMADDLTEIQGMFPEPIGYYDELFADWNGSTGMHVALTTPYWISEALYISRLFEGRKLL